MYSVTLWGSHPDDENDDCWTGEDFASLSEGRDCFANWEKRFPASATLCTRYVMLDGPNVNEIVCVKKRLPPDYSDERRERAMEAGMLHGVDAYNDELGY